jgi:hypothetical protein
MALTPGFNVIKLSWHNLRGYRPNLSQNLRPIGDVNYYEKGVMALTPAANLINLVSIIFAGYLVKTLGNRLIVM